MKPGAKNPFDTAHLESDLKGRTVRGGVTTLAAQAVGLVLNVLSIVILARILSPADFGLVAMVTALIGIAAMFKDSGLSAATIQRSTVNHDQISNLFWTNVALSVGLGLCIAAAAPAIVWLYNEPRLLPITLAVAAVFVIDGSALQHQALLRRQMRFGALALIQVASNLLALIAAVAAALGGAGYWALVIQVAVRQVASTFLAWTLSGWVPSRPRQAAGTRSMLGFGGYLTGFSFVNYFARNVDDVLIGRVWGGSELGFYAKAYQILTLPLQQINGPIAAVATPALSRLQEKPEEFRDFFRQVLGVIAALTLPLVGWMILCRRELVLLLLGAQWEAAIGIFGWLAISAFAQPIGNISGVLYVALGRAKRMFKWGLMSSAWLVAAFFVGIPYGAVGVACAYSVAVLMMMPALIAYAVSGTPVRWQDFFDSIKFPAVATLVMALAGFIAGEMLDSSSSLWARLLIITAVMWPTYLVTIYLLKPELLGTFLKVLKSRRNALPEPAR